MALLRDRGVEIASGNQGHAPAKAAQSADDAAADIEGADGERKRDARHRDRNQQYASAHDGGAGVVRSQPGIRFALRHQLGDRLFQRVGKRSVGGEAAFAYDPPTPEANACSGESRARLEMALLKVPTKYREVLVLKDAEDLSYEEIHSILQLPITTLKIRVVRARAMLREIIESQGLTASGMVMR